jgi:AcrR family transcriptional regulator
MYAESLLSICEEKSLDKITIEDIIKHAHTARQTFYNHFKDKYDLINFIYQYKSFQIMDKYSTSYTWEECIKCRMDFCLQHKNFFISASRLDDFNNFQNFFYNHTAEYYRNFIISNYGSDTLTETLNYAIKFYCYGSQGLFMDWIKSGMKQPTADLAKLLFDCMPIELKQYIK